MAPSKLPLHEALVDPKTGKVNIGSAWSNILSSASSSSNESEIQTIVSRTIATSITIIGDNAITSSNIQEASIEGINIANATIKGINIKNATITGDNIDEATIEGINIANATITGANIENATITGDNIVSGTITATQIEDASITGIKIANATITGANIELSTIVGGNIANGTIESGNIASQTIQAGNIENLTITASQIAHLTITGGADGTDSNIATHTISNDNIVAHTITALEIAAQTITANEIAANTITASQILANTITANEIEANTITAESGIIASISADTITVGSLRGINLQAGTYMTKGSYLTSDSTSGDTILHINNTTDFPASGSGQIIDTTNDRDTFTYTGTTSNTLTGCSGVLTHNNGAVVVPLIKNMVINKSINEMRFFGNRGDSTIEELASIGLLENSGDIYIGLFGSTTSSIIGLSGRSNTNYGITASSETAAGIFAYSSNGYGGLFRAVPPNGLAPIILWPSGSASAPTHDAEGGSLWVTSVGILFINTEQGNHWQKVSEQ